MMPAACKRLESHEDRLSRNHFRHLVTSSQDIGNNRNLFVMVYAPPQKKRIYLKFGGAVLPLHCSCMMSKFFFILQLGLVHKAGFHMNLKMDLVQQ